jgi:hypothetical protein
MIPEKAELPHYSGYLENALRHVFLAGLMSCAWRKGMPPIQVSNAEVDDQGYDIVLAVGDIVRYIQLKGTISGGKRRAVDLNINLEKRIGGCCVWYFYDLDSLEIKHFHYFGAGPFSKIPTLDSYKQASHTRRNIDGNKPLRKNTKNVAKSNFRKLNTWDELLGVLFSENETVANKAE